MNNKGEVPIYSMKGIQKYVVCVDDSKPDNLEAEDWIVQGQAYLLRGWVDTAMNHSDESVYLLNRIDGTEMRVSASIQGYRSSRFIDCDVLTYGVN